MALIPISHARALSSPSDASALFRVLRERRVEIRGLRTRDPVKLARVVEAVEAKTEHTISWEGGSLANARVALDRLASSGTFGYLDVRASGSNLRSWPRRHTWVHGNEGDELETTSIAEALARFHATSGELHQRSFVMRIRDAAKPLLIELVRALEAEVHAVLEVELAVARELTELYAGEPVDWAAGGISVTFPSGAIMGFLKTPNVEDKYRAKWHARIDKALRKARLSGP